MADELERVRREAARSRQTSRRLVEAVKAAHAAGRTLREIATAAGISHEGVRGLLRKEAPDAS